jgi:hypothetical protein
MLNAPALNARIGSLPGAAGRCTGQGAVCAKARTTTSGGAIIRFAMTATFPGHQRAAGCKTILAGPS